MEILPPPTPGTPEHKNDSTPKVNVALRLHKNNVQLQEVLALRGRKLTVQQLPILTSDGPDTYTGVLKIYVRDHIPGETVEVLTTTPLYTNQGKLTRAYARPEDILQCQVN